MSRLLTAIIFLLGISSVYAAKVDTVEVYSASMKKKVKTVVVSPEKGAPKATLYLLHGYSGNYGNWVNKTPQIKNWVDQNEYLIVCPDGGYDSWYWDIEGTGDRYETFVSKELVSYIEQQYGAPADRTKRGITGLSMGGHGALYLAIRHQDVFANAGSTSGGVDIRPFPNNWSIKKRIGEYHDNQTAWNEHTVIELIHQIRPGNLKLFIDCGTEDFFFGVNNALHEKLTYMNVAHDYLTMPGKHDWNYWSKSIDFQMAFFNQCFQEKPAAK
ncbi:esterase family protein [Sphingobacterium psychroaquaticum]|uniref:alpha/beta hydrolase n=1 Tax=Sphingobacterium psychroaquaticum TaxID=561061 RepID=UPI00106D637F|nr:alpha/beta hydrolase family protein [Sphingobacterium psychroaquaticum]QBQ42144.1 esterase family protein [Sphingobacterium psychroaquaticum]